MMETYANNLEAIVDDRTRQVIGKFSFFKASEDIMMLLV